MIDVNSSILRMKGTIKSKWMRLRSLFQIGSLVSPEKTKFLKNGPRDEKNGPRKKKKEKISGSTLARFCRELEKKFNMPYIPLNSDCPFLSKWGPLKNAENCTFESNLSTFDLNKWTSPKNFKITEKYGQRQITRFCRDFEGQRLCDEWMRQIIIIIN